MQSKRKVADSFLKCNRDEKEWTQNVSIQTETMIVSEKGVKRQLC